MNEVMSYKQGVYTKLIDRFADSGNKICEITFTNEDREGRNDKAIYNGIDQAIKRYNKWHIKVIKRNDKFYLVNTLK
jgi:hypothetical protein